MLVQVNYLQENFQRKNAFIIKTTAPTKKKKLHKDTIEVSVIHI